MLGGKPNKLSSTTNMLGTALLCLARRLWREIFVPVMEPLGSKQLCPVSFVVSLEDGMRWKRHSDHLRPCGSREEISFPTELSTGDIDLPENSSVLEIAPNSHEPQPAV